MTPDKVEAALGVFKDAIRYEVRAEADPGWIAEMREALSVLTEALAERERDAARYRWLRTLRQYPDGEPKLIYRWHGVAYQMHYDEVREAHGDELDIAIDAAIKDTDHAS